MGQEAGHMGGTLLPMTAQTAAKHNLSVSIVLLLRTILCPFSLTPSPSMSRKGTASTEGGAAPGAPQAAAVLSTHPWLLPGLMGPRGAASHHLQPVLASVLPPWVSQLSLNLLPHRAWDRTSTDGELRTHLDASPALGLQEIHRGRNAGLEREAQEEV